MGGLAGIIAGIGQAAYDDRIRQEDEERSAVKTMASLFERAAQDEFLTPQQQQTLTQAQFNLLSGKMKRKDADALYAQTMRERYNAMQTPPPPSGGQQASVLPPPGLSPLERPVELTPPPGMSDSPYPAGTVGQIKDTAETAKQRRNAELIQRIRDTAEEAKERKANERLARIAQDYKDGKISREEVGILTGHNLPAPPSTTPVSLQDKVISLRSKPGERVQASWDPKANIYYVAGKPVPAEDVMPDPGSARSGGADDEYTELKLKNEEAKLGRPLTGPEKEKVLLSARREWQTDPEIAELRKAIMRTQQNNAASGVNPRVMRAEEQMFDDFLKVSKDFKTIRDFYDRIEVSAQNPSPAGDLGVIFSYMKMLDAQSTVREGEQATAENARGVPESVRTAYNRFLTGTKLGAGQRADFINRARQIYQTELKLHQRTEQFFKEKATRNGLNPGNVVLDLRSMQAPAEGAPSGGNAPIVEQNKRTGAFRYSLDGRKTWQAGKPPQR